MIVKRLLNQFVRFTYWEKSLIWGELSTNEQTHFTLRQISGMHRLKTPSEVWRRASSCVWKLLSASLQSLLLQKSWCWEFGKNMPFPICFIIKCYVWIRNHWIKKLYHLIAFTKFKAPRLELIGKAAMIHLGSPTGRTSSEKKMITKQPVPAMHSLNLVRFCCSYGNWTHS